MRKKYVFADILAISIGSLILALGINFFLVPNNIAAGGVSGIATVLFLKFGISMALTVFLLNGIIFAFGFKLLSGYELIKSFAGTAMLSLFLELTKGIYSYSEDLLIAAVFGGLLSGIGIGITVSRGASTGGSDMTALMVSRKIKTVSIAAVIFVFDAVVIAVSGFAFESVTAMLYAALAVYVSAKTADVVAVYGKSVKSVEIISEKHEQIAEEIIRGLKRGVTGLYAKGLYKGQDKMMLMCIVSRRELGRVLRIVKAFDKDAFVMVDDVKQVLGEGFESID